jgi:hypothetical protein
MSSGRLSTLAHFVRTTISTALQSASSGQFIDLKKPEDLNLQLLLHTAEPLTRIAGVLEYDKQSVMFTPNFISDRSDEVREILV